MSIALDIALYLRENETDLSAADRGILFTLAFRVGSNPFSWISQSVLAKELGMTERGLRKRIAKIVENKFIEIIFDPKDRRKNMYRPEDFLINYHLKRRESQNKYRNKSSGICEDIGTKVPVISEDIGTKVPVIKKTNHYQVTDITEEILLSNPTKETYINKVTYKDKQKELRSVNVIEIPAWLNKELWEEFKQFRKEMKKPMTDLVQKKVINKLYKMREEGQNVEDVLNQSIANGWQGIFEVKSTKERNYENQQSNERKSAAQRFWERNTAGLPEYDKTIREREISTNTEGLCAATDFLF